jgi:hypothetical protein
MTQLMTADPVSLDEEQRRSLDEQIARLGPGEPWMAVKADDGRVYVRGTRGVPQALITLWKRNPSAMIPANASYRHETRTLDIDDFGRD